MQRDSQPASFMTLSGETFFVCRVGFRHLRYLCLTHSGNGGNQRVRTVRCLFVKPRKPFSGALYGSPSPLVVDEPSRVVSFWISSSFEINASLDSIGRLWFDAQELMPGSRSHLLPDLIVRWGEHNALTGIRSDRLGSFRGELGSGRGGDHRRAPATCNTAESTSARLIPAPASRQDAANLPCLLWLLRR